MTNPIPISAYTGKSLHVSVCCPVPPPSTHHYAYTVWTNDGNEPIARCVDSGTAHLLAVAPKLAETLRELIAEIDREDLARDGISFELETKRDAARAALTKAGL